MTLGLHTCPLRAQLLTGPLPTVRQRRSALKEFLLELQRNLKAASDEEMAELERRLATYKRWQGRAGEPTRRAMLEQLDERLQTHNLNNAWHLNDAWLTLCNDEHLDRTPACCLAALHAYAYLELPPFYLICSAFSCVRGTTASTQQLASYVAVGLLALPIARPGPYRGTAACPALQAAVPRYGPGGARRLAVR